MAEVCHGECIPADDTFNDWVSECRVYGFGVLPLFRLRLGCRSGFFYSTVIWKQHYVLYTQNMATHLDKVPEQQHRFK